MGSHTNEKSRKFLQGTGIRERLLRSVGSGDLYDTMATLEQANQGIAAQNSSLISQLEKTQAELREARAAISQLHAEQGDSAQRLSHFEFLSTTSRLIELDYPVLPRVRGGYGVDTEKRISSIISEGDARYSETIASFRPVIDAISKIPAHSDNPGEPHWVNNWIPAFDGVSIYAQLVTRNPATYFEIGSGTSTKFARRAIRDFGLRTKIISVDPFPRSEIDAICDEIIRVPFQEVPISAYPKLGPGDVLFFDGSHRSFQNSDVTVFFTETLPALPAGLSVGIHDIYLPSDYPEAWLARYYNEQYLLACWLLSGSRIRIDLPLFYCSYKPQLNSILNDLWSSSSLGSCDRHGTAFWVTPQ